MTGDDWSGVVATLSYIIAQDLGVAGVPDSEADMRELVVGWVAAESAPAQAAADVADFDGIGFGFDPLSIGNVLTIVVESLLGASMHVGLIHVHDAIVRWRRDRTSTDSMDVAEALRPTDSMLHSELYRRLLGVGVADEQARFTTELAMAAMAMTPDRRT